MRKLGLKQISVSVVLFLLWLTSLAGAQTGATCFPAWINPGTWQSSQANPITVSGSVTMGFMPNCNPGVNFSAVSISAGCDDSINPSCTGWINPFGGFPGGYFNQVIYTTAANPGYGYAFYSVPLSLSAFTVNELYDVDVVLLDANGNELGNSSWPPCAQGRPASEGGPDCDMVLNVVQQSSSSGGSSGGSGTPAIVSCSPTVTAPSANAVLDGSSVSIGATSGCNGSYDYLRWSFGPAGGHTETGYVELPLGTSSGTLNTTQYPDGDYQVSVGAIDSNGNVISGPNGGWAPLVYFTINN
jgi:hypothetical protein